MEGINSSVTEENRSNQALSAAEDGQRGRLIFTKM